MLAPPLLPVILVAPIPPVATPVCRNGLSPVLCIVKLEANGAPPVAEEAGIVGVLVPPVVLAVGGTTVLCEEMAEKPVPDGENGLVDERWILTPLPLFIIVLLFKNDPLFPKPIGVWLFKERLEPNPVEGAWPILLMPPLDGAAIVLLRLRKGLPVACICCDCRNGLEPVVTDERPLEVVLCILNGVGVLLMVVDVVLGVPKGCCWACANWLGCCC